MRKGWSVITPDHGSRNLELDQIQNIFTISIVLMCVLGPGRGGSWSEDLPRANQVGWGFETTACEALGLWGLGLACGNGRCGYRMAQDGEEAKVLQRWAETHRRKRHRLPAVLETCSTNVRRRREKNTNVFKEKGKSLNSAAHQPAGSLPEGGTCWHVATQNTRCAEVSCTCKTTGILGETGYERGIPPGTSSLPDSAER